jgi:hypothetical protein
MATTNSSISQFQAVAEERGSERLGCNEVRRLLEMAGPDRAEFEDFLRKVSKDLMSDRPQRSFATIYSDGEWEIWRSLDGIYLESEIPKIETYTDFAPRRR